MNARTITFLVLCASTALPPASGRAQFCPDAGDPMSTGANTRPNAVVVGDVTGDGWPDICTANDSSDDVSVLPSLGGGLFGAAVIWDVGDEPTSLALADVDGDGPLDIAVANRSASEVTLLLNDGNGSFVSAPPLALQDMPIRIAVARLDAGPDVDLVLTSAVANSVTVLLSQGGGSFSSPVLYPTNDEAPNGLAIADVDGDGDPDVVAGNTGATVGMGTASVFLNDGFGGFAPAINYDVGANAFDIAVADVDGANGPDILTVDGIGNVLTVTPNQGNGTFGLPTPYPAGTGGYAITTCDLDCDGAPDVLTTNLVSDDLTYFLNQGGGDFSVLGAVPIGSNPSSVACADLDDDGGLDATVAFQSGVTMVTNSCSDCEVVGAPASPVSEPVSVRVSPNPFAGAARIAYDLPRAGHVRIEAFDASGRLVRTLLDAQRDAGRHVVTWSGASSAGHSIAPGVYHLRVITTSGEVGRSVAFLR